MAAKYNPKRIIQLLSICSWKNQSALNYTGFGTLADVINAKLIKDERSNQNSEDVKQKYLNQLFIDAEKKLGSNEPIGKDEYIINSILHFIGCPDWESFNQKLIVLESYLKWTNIDFSSYKTIDTVLFYPKKAPIQIESELNTVSQELRVPLNFEESQLVDAKEIIENLDKLRQISPVVLWCISNEWDRILKPHIDTIKKVLESGQIIPIRIGDQLEVDNLVNAFIQSKLNISGLNAILMALTIIEFGFKSLGNSSQNDEIIMGVKTNLNIQNNSGTIFTGEGLEIKGENVALRDFIQNVNPKPKDNE